MLMKNESAGGMSRLELRRLKRKRKKTRKRILLSLMLILMISIGILFTPVFNLKGITVSGNSKIKTEDIIKKSGFKVGENIFKFKLNESGEAINSIPYVNSVRITRKLPGKVEIVITESIPMAYIPYNNTYIVVDKDGKALEVKTDEINYDIPILTDFKLTKFTLGKNIEEKDSEKLKKTLEITKHLYNNNLIDKVKSISSKKDDFYLELNENLRVVLGDTQDLSAKLNMIKGALLKLPEDTTGILDIKNPDRLYHRSE